MGWISVREAWERLGRCVSRQTIYAMLNSGQLLGRRMRGKRLVSAEALQALLDADGLPPRPPSMRERPAPRRYKHL